MKRLITIFLLLMPLMAEAEWVSITKSESMDEFFVDYSTAKRNGNFVDVWILTNYAKKTRHDLLSATVYHKLNCSNISAQTISTNFYFGPMATSFDTSYTPPKPEWSFYPPGSTLHFLISTVCKYR
jgi:hypothetical protein